MSPNRSQTRPLQAGFVERIAGALSKIAQGLLSATTPKLAPAGHVAAIARRNTFPESLATAAKTSILVKFIRAALTRPEPKQQP